MYALLPILTGAIIEEFDPIKYVTKYKDVLLKAKTIIPVQIC